MDPLTLIILAQAAAPAANQVWISVIIALVGGGAGLKLVETLLGRGKVKVDEAALIRSELRTEVDSLRNELRSVETELDKWKAKYYRLVGRINSAKLPIDLSDLIDEPLDKPL